MTKKTKTPTPEPLTLYPRPPQPLPSATVPQVPPLPSRWDIAAALSEELRADIGPGDQAVDEEIEEMEAAYKATPRQEPKS